MRLSEMVSRPAGRLVPPAILAATLVLVACNSAGPGGGPPGPVAAAPTIPVSTAPLPLDGTAGPAAPPAVPGAPPPAPGTPVATLPPTPPAGPGLPNRALPFPPPPPPPSEMTGRERALAALPDYCPPVEIRQGGAAFIVYEPGGGDDPTRIRYQATINQFPRNCVDQAGTLTINLGVAGLLLTGPRGAPGSITIPLHIEVIQDVDTVVFDRVFPTAATIPPGQLRTEFTRVEQIVVPSPPRENMRVYVSFAR